MFISIMRKKGKDKNNKQKRMGKNPPHRSPDEVHYKHHLDKRKHSRQHFMMVIALISQQLEVPVISMADRQKHRH